jgi:ketosteroid isomerase-like protein
MAKRLTAALLIAALAAVVLAACGGSSQGSSQGGSTSGTSEEAPSTPPSNGTGQAQSPPSGKSPGKTQSKPPAEAHPKPHYEGGEESVEKYGSEAEGSDEEAIAGAEQAYLSAVAEKDFGAACSYLAASVTHSLEQFAAPRLKAKGCPGILPELLAPTAPAVARQQAEGEIRKVRVKGDMAFVIFHAPGARLYVLTMRREGGRWKATTIAGSILAPSAATLGSG